MNTIALLIVLGLFLAPPLVGFLLLRFIRQEKTKLLAERNRPRKEFILKRKSDRLIKEFANRILAVDDDPSVLKAISLTLSRSGYAVDTAELGEEALRKVAKKQYNAVLLDLSLPDRHGYDVLRDFREKDSVTPVLIVTGTERKPEAGLASGASDYILKPYEAGELAARVGRAVRESFGVRGSKSKYFDIEIDFINKSASLFNENLQLSKREFAALEILALRGDVPTSANMVLEHLSFGGQEKVEIDDLQKHLNEINNKLSSIAGGVLSINIEEDGRVRPVARRLM